MNISDPYSIFEVGFCETTDPAWGIDVSDDYAYLAAGLIALHRATGDDRWRELAKEITDKQIELFWDEVAGGFFFTSKDHPSLIVRVKDPVDGAIPSGASVSARFQCRSSSSS